MVSRNKPSVTERTFDLWMIVTCYLLVSKYEEACRSLTLRGRPSAISNAIWPILRDARSVMRRVARASRPFSVGMISSCLTYCPRTIT